MNAAIVKRSLGLLVVSLLAINLAACDEGGGGGDTSSSSGAGSSGNPTGGSSGNPTGGSSGGSSSSGGSGGSVTFEGGYLTTGPWMGYVFTFADTLGTTISPTCDDTGCTPAWGSQACVKGSVIGDDTYQSFAGVGFKVNSPKEGTEGTWTVTGAGVLVDVSTPPTGGRVQLEEPNAADNSQRYCAPIPAGGKGLIPFSDLKTYCWGDAMNPSVSLTEGKLIGQAAITIPGAQTETTFDFCLANLVPQ